MGRYKTERIYYPNRWQPTENLIADGYYYAQKKPSETIEIAAHIIASARVNDDDELFNVGCDLMRLANSPCIFQPDYTAETATDNNNRPSEPIRPAFLEDYMNICKEDEEIWDSSRDGIFNKKIKPQAVKKAIDTVESEITDRPYYYVAFRILKILKYIPLNTSPHDFLLWVNLHFNCGWSEERKKRHQLSFRLEGILKKLSKKHPSEWKDAANDGKKFWGNKNIEYYNLAISFKNVFTITMDKGKPVIDSESYEHLKDRVEFLSGARDICGSLWVSEEAYINNGK